MEVQYQIVVILSRSLLSSLCPSLPLIFWIYISYMRGNQREKRGESRRQKSTANIL